MIKRQKIEIIAAKQCKNRGVLSASSKKNEKYDSNINNKNLN